MSGLAGLWPLQKALYAHLAADAGLAAELGDPPRIHDAPPGEGSMPRDAAMPYLVLGEATARPLPGHEGAAEHDIRLRIVSRHGGRREVKRVMDALSLALHDADFPVEGARLVGCALVSADAPRRSADAFEGVARFRLVTEAA